MGRRRGNFVVESVPGEEWDFRRLSSSDISLPLLSALSPGPQLKLVTEPSFYRQQKKPLQRVTYGAWDVCLSGDREGDSTRLKISFLK